MPKVSPTTRRASWKRWLWRAAGLPLGFAVFYAAFVSLGYITVNRDYQPPAEADRVIIFVRSNEIHTDLVFPVNDPGANIDWREYFPAEHFYDDIRHARFVALGWGERAFYMETPSWDEVKIANVCSALFLPSESVLHVEFLAAAEADAWTREVHVSRAQYETLVEHVKLTLYDDAYRHPISAGETTYGTSDHFYQARGSYHMFNTCNQWTGRALKRAGVPTGIWTPLKDQVLRPLPAVKSSKASKLVDVGYVFRRYGLRGAFPRRLTRIRSICQIRANLDACMGIHRFANQTSYLEPMTMACNAR